MARIKDERIIVDLQQIIDNSDHEEVVAFCARHKISEAFVQEAKEIINRYERNQSDRFFFHRGSKQITRNKHVILDQVIDECEELKLFTTLTFRDRKDVQEIVETLDNVLGVNSNSQDADHGGDVAETEEDAPMPQADGEAEEVDDGAAEEEARRNVSNEVSLIIRRLRGYLRMLASISRLDAEALQRFGRYGYTAERLDEIRALVQKAFEIHSEYAEMIAHRGKSIGLRIADRRRLNDLRTIIRDKIRRKLKYEPYATSVLIQRLLGVDPKTSRDHDPEAPAPQVHVIELPPEDHPDTETNPDPESNPIGVEGESLAEADEKQEPGSGAVADDQDPMNPPDPVPEAEEEEDASDLPNGRD